MTFQATLNFSTPGRGTTNITRDIQQVVADSGIETGLTHVFIHHTSASLMLCENADPDVLADLERFMTKLVPDGSPMFQHSAEGPDDMPAHVRSVITQTGLSMPVANGACDLGTWQGVYLWEHRIQAHQRRITVTVTG
jgi:secondary thiamine-phosphate synthase enzyme